MWFITYYLLGIILIPGIIYAIVTQNKVQSTFKTFSEINSETGLTAKEACERILQQKGITDVSVVKTSGHLTDNYNPTNKTLSLSDSVYNSTSIASIGVAAHEAGHAIQHAEGYKFLKLRSGLIRVSNFMSNMLLPLIIIGIILSALAYTSIGSIFVIGGCVFFGVSVIISLVTLPVEFNASKRALACLTSSCVLSETETKGARQVLSAAAQTYVASLVVSILSFLRFILSILLTREE